MKLKFKKHVLPTITLITAAVAMPVQAGLICTGTAPGGPGPLFNGDLTDSTCDLDNVNAALGTSWTYADIIGSKTESFGDPITSWAQDEFGLGTLTITSSTDTSGTWELDGSAAPLFFVDKYDGMYDIYTYMGAGTSPYSDDWTRASGATTSHLSVYGVVPIPAAVWLFGSGLIGLIGIARRKKS